MKKIASLFALVFTFAVLTLAIGADTFNGTMVRSNNADPNLFFHDGYYYLTQTGTSRIAVFETEHVDELGTLKLSSNISYSAYLNGTVYDPTVTELFGEGASISGTWSPEIHYFSEEDFPGNSGWYMFLGLRKNTGDASVVRMVVLKSTTDSPKGPYGHPTKGTKNYSQPLLDKNGDVWDEWGCGQTVLNIPEGPYKGIYTMWVAEEGRGSTYGGKYGDFYQKIMIAKLSTPWQLASDPGIVTTPTQSWEYAGASTTHPRVVEGATPVYGKNGEIFLTYSGSGYWSDYGLGQLTWNGGDPLLTSSWVKLPVANGNPIFSATTAKNLRGAGHASFLTDTSGNGFFCYHAYAYDAATDTKASARDAYIEPYYIDYTKWNGVSYGVIKLGMNGNGVPADTASTVTFATDGTYLTAPSITAEGGESIKLTISESGANGYIIYRSTDGKTFNYLTTVDATTYTDSDVEIDSTYYYRAYAYREEEISDVSETVSAAAHITLKKPGLIVSSGNSLLAIAWSDCEGMKVYRSTDGESYVEVFDYDTPMTAGERYFYKDDNVSFGNTYYYYVVNYSGDVQSPPSAVAKYTVTTLDPPSVLQTSVSCTGIEIHLDGEHTECEVYRSTDGESYELYGKFEGNSFEDTDFAVNQSYYYKFKGINGEYVSEFSEAAGPLTPEHKPLVEYSGLDATCTEKGYTAYVQCDTCDEVISGKEEIPATGHVDTETVTVDASCTEPGSVTVTCKCGAIVSVEEIAATGHSYEETEAEVPATTTSVGKTAVYTCASCGDSYGGEEIPMLEDTDEFTMTGDADKDGKITLIDVLRTLKAVVGEEVKISRANADIDGDGELEAADVLAIIKVFLDA
ncbi:MAG: family 43 glycosylhydrolase [Clostridia bacterium]|nr:family 43 glycosylhydrolase [Clostridia bacterium]